MRRYLLIVLALVVMIAAGAVLLRGNNRAAASEVNQHNVQTTLTPPGGAAMVDFEVDVPGTYALVDHAIFRAMNKGTVGHLKVVGPENPDISAEGELKPYELAESAGATAGAK